MAACAAGCLQCALRRHRRGRQPRDGRAPLSFSKNAQAWAGRAHLEAAIKALEDFVFFEDRGNTRLVKEGIGVAALITPWNWPLNQIVTKVAPALAAGCTMVLKPSEIAPISGLIFAEVVHEIGLPKGVFNLVNGDGPSVGQVLAGHPDVDVVSFTGSTRAGVLVAKAAADTVKRVSQELGGKSANIILPDADFEVAVAKGVKAVMGNSGQSCDAPTRMLVPAAPVDARGFLTAPISSVKSGSPPRAEELVSWGTVHPSASPVHNGRMVAPRQCCRLNERSKTLFLHPSPVYVATHLASRTPIASPAPGRSHQGLRRPEGPLTPVRARRAAAGAPNALMIRLEIVERHRQSGPTSSTTAKNPRIEKHTFVLACFFNR